MDELSLREYARFIKNMRMSIDFTPQKLAKEMNMKTATLYGYERGDRWPRNRAKFEQKLRDVVKREQRKLRQQTIKINA